MNQFLELCRTRATKSNKQAPESSPSTESWKSLEPSSHQEIQLLSCTPEILENKQYPKPIQIRRSAEGSPACYGYQMIRAPDVDITGESSCHTHPSFFGYQKNHRYTYPTLLSNSRYFNFDAVPKLLLSDGKMVDEIVASGVGNYLEFKSVDALYFISPENKKDPFSQLQIQKLPGSKADIFNSKMISALEKRSLMKVIQFAIDYGRRHDGLPVETLNENELASGRALLRPQNKDSSKSLPSDAQSVENNPTKPFREFLAESGVPTSLEPFITFGLGLEASNSCSSSAGLLGIYRHISASGKFGNTSFLVPVYGTSEFAQAFCRLSAVWGGIFILRESVTHYTLKESEISENSSALPRINSVKLSNGRSISCNYIICEDATRWRITTLVYESMTQKCKHFVIRQSVVDRSWFPEENSVRGVVVLPPRLPSLGNEYAIYVYQFDSSMSVAPSGLYMVYYLTYINPQDDDSSTSEYANKLMSNVVQQMKDLANDFTELLQATFLHPYKPMTNAAEIPSNVYETGDPASEDHLLYIHESAIKAEQIFKSICPDQPFLSDPIVKDSIDTPHDPEEEGLNALLAAAVTTNNESPSSTIPNSDSS